MGLVSGLGVGYRHRVTHNRLNPSITFMNSRITFVKGLWSWVGVVLEGDFSA